ILQLLRESGKSCPQMARSGHFQQMLSGQTMQMLRVCLDERVPYFPEISANKYAINIRFTGWANDQRSVACEADVDFDLTLCSL
ncbi:MAG: cell division protein ZapD, partial [Burkholderiales bacterium]